MGDDPLRVSPKGYPLRYASGYCVILLLADLVTARIEGHTGAASSAALRMIGDEVEDGIAAARRFAHRYALRSGEVVGTPDLAGRMIQLLKSGDSTCELVRPLALSHTLSSPGNSAASASAFRILPSSFVHPSCVLQWGLSQQLVSTCVFCC